MKLTEERLRQIIREELKEQSGFRRSMKYSRAAEDAYDAAEAGDVDEYLLELRSMLHAAGQAMLSGEQVVQDRRMQEAMDRVSEAQIILKEIQES